MKSVLEPFMFKLFVSAKSYTNNSKTYDRMTRIQDDAESSDISHMIPYLIMSFDFVKKIHGNSKHPNPKKNS